MPLLATEPGRLRPVLALNVVDDGALLPSQQGWNDQADALAAARRGEGKNVLGAVVPEVVQVPGAFVVPAADVDATVCVEQSGGENVGFGGPPRRPVQIFGVL